MPRHSPYALIRLNFFCLVLSIFSWIAWVSWTFLFRFVNSCEKVLSFFVLNCFSTFRWNCILPKLERPIISTSDLVKFICPLICSFLTLQYSLFGFQWTYFLRFVRLDLISHRVGIFDLSATSPSFGRGNVPLVGSSGLEPPTSRLSGARSNHLSYEPIQFLSVYLVHSLTFFLLPSLSSYAFRSLTIVLVCSPSALLPRVRLRRLAAWWRWWESNPWPPACRAGALPAELHPH